MQLSVVSLVFLSAAVAAAQAPDPPEVSSPVHLAPEAAAALVEKRVPAVYPGKASQKGVQGSVVLRVIIAENGDVKDASVVSGDPELTQAAIDSMRQWKYKPYAVDGKPVLVETQVTFGFHIKPPPPPPPLGKFEDGQYRNEFFGIGYPLSTEWVRETGIVRRQLASGSNVPSSTQVLLAALHVPSKSDGLVADSSLVIVATAVPAQADARENLVSEIVTLQAEKMGKPRGEITSITVAGLTIYRADVQPSKGGADHQSILCAVAKGYLLRWNFLATSESALDDAVGTLMTMTKWEAPPTPVPSSTPPGAVSRDEVVRISSGVSAGRIVKKVAPSYPPDAKYAHVQGTVVLHATIDKSGNVIDLEAIAGPVELVPSSVSAVRQWKYRPYLLKGEPIEIDTTIEVRYTLGG